MTDEEIKMFTDAAKEMFGPNTKQLSASQVRQVCEKTDMRWPFWLRTDMYVHQGERYYRFSELEGNVPDADEGIEEKMNALRQKAKLDHEQKMKEKVSNVPMNDTPMSPSFAVEIEQVVTKHSLIPDNAIGYVPFGHFNDIEMIVHSEIFYPVYITGFSGNGKTIMVEQIHAKLRKELIRVNITIETDEDDLLGGFRLVNGRTVWHDGPVVVAMERGATLLLDEVDLGSNKMMCLQPVLEGKQIYLKKINRTVHPAPGFNVIATANTKGKGSEDGRFIGTNVQNEAFLDRYAVTFEQDYPVEDIEMKILANTLAKTGKSDPAFIKRLTKWAGSIRQSFNQGSVSEIISTRRLVNICDAYTIFGSKRKAIELCISRFDQDTKNAFIKFYDSLDETEKDPKDNFFNETNAIQTF